MVYHLIAMTRETNESKRIREQESKQKDKKKHVSHERMYILKHDLYP